jgi:hypothetical protein
MATLGHLWAGHVYGTNTGNLFVELNTSGQEVTGTLRFMDNLFGLVLYRVAGSFNGTLKLNGTPVHSRSSAELGDLTIVAILTSEGNLRGEWCTSLGSGGTFQAYPHDIPVLDQRAAHTGTTPEQLYTSNISIGAIRLYSQDVEELVRLVRRDFLTGRPVLTYAVRGNEATKYYEDFKVEADQLPELRYLKLTIQEPEAHGINKLVVAELNAHGENVIRVQGINESWVVGKAEAVARTLRLSEKGLVTNYKKFGLGLNQVIFLAMLVLIPDIPSLWYRLLFVASVVILLTALYWMHQRFIPNAVIYLSDRRPSALQRAWPTMLSWLVAATASLAGALVFYWLTKSTP